METAKRARKTTKLTDFKPMQEENKRLKQLNAELMEALQLALPYMNVFAIRDEEPLVGENLKTDLFKIQSAIAKAKGQ